ncbi:MMPL family transporter [Streptomyces sp. A0958]|uniref:MMPL family transporter n=1 Tax=Streptomyces sp. A0958 TaxID=2563101 RepID=UPI00109E4E4B|nr:MMPL family transporter [Streptomyces sp. A0958]THA60260.1 MMPL family transporter [Streptomyces sp. A0958]
MAQLLYRLGRMAFRQRRYITLMWVALLAVAGFAAANAPAAPDDEAGMPGTESQRAFDLMDQRFPGGKSDGADARLVFVAPNGQKVTATENKKAIVDAVDAVAKGAQTDSALNPFTSQAVSEDGSTAYATITYKAKAADLTQDSKSGLQAAAQTARDAGLTVEIGGSALAEDEFGGSSEVFGVVGAAVILLITFGSLAAAGMPLLTALIGVGVGVASITALGSTLGLSQTTTTLGVMLGLAVGIDYAMFIVSRYREERVKGHDPEKAVGLAVGSAGSAVVFAGLTVVIALAGLSVIGIPMLAKMGLAAAGVVTVAVVIALTLVPALLGFFHRAVLPRRTRRAKEPVASQAGKPNAGTRWARFVLRRPLLVLLLGVVGLGVIAVPALDLQLGLPGDEVKATSTTERRAYDDLASGFGPGFNGPLTVVVDAKGAENPKAAADTVAAEVAGTKGIVSVSPPVFNKAGDTALLSAVPSTAPTDSRTDQVIHDVREQADRFRSDTGATVLVSGMTAMNIDVAQKVKSALVPYIAIVVGLAFLLMMVIFRSVLVPLKAALGFLLSVSAALGAVVAVFQWGWLSGFLGVEQTGPILSMMPLFMIGIVFGLAMDYEVFLVTRMREAYVRGDSPGEAVVSGFRNSARVVVAAALIMMAVFGGFIGAGASMIKMIGFSMAIAVFFDAFVVRMAIVPAVLALLGDRAWWLPRWLERILPHVDVEGEALTQPHEKGEAPQSSTEPESVLAR